MPPTPAHWVLDANILFSEWGRWLMVTLANAAPANLYWTELIEEECYRNLVRLGRIHPEDASRQRRVLSTHMNAKVESAPGETLALDLKSVHEKDRHVAATALSLRHRHNTPVGLITWNIKDFPKRALLKLGVVRYTPDELALDVWKTAQQGLNALQTASQNMILFHAECPVMHVTDYQQKARPLPVSENDWLEFLGRNRLHKLSRLLTKV